MNRFASTVWLGRSLSGALLVLTLLTLHACAARNDPPAATTLDTKTREEVFDLVWSRINERFYDPTFHGVDWAAMRKRYQPQAIEAKTDGEFYETLNKMLGELKQSHIGIIPPEAYTEEETAKGGDPEKAVGTAGIVVQWVEEQPVITHIVPGSAAAKAGLRPGFVLTTVGGHPMTEIIERFHKRIGNQRDFPTVVRLAMERLFEGAVGSDLVVEYKDADDKRQTVTLKRTPLPGTVVRFGELPPLPVEVETRTLPGGFGYIRANIFLMPILDPIRAAVHTMVHSPGIIIDLRGNPGGLGILAGGIAGSFYSQQTGLGTMKMRQGNINFLAYPQAPVFKGPLVILTDEGSVSTSEVFAGGMQENGRAVVIGGPTAGMVLPSVVEVLPGGARFQYAFADFKTPRGVLLEGRGVMPNVPVTLTRRALLTADDPVLDAAISYLKTKGATKKK